MACWIGNNKQVMLWKFSVIMLPASKNSSVSTMTLLVSWWLGLLRIHSCIASNVPLLFAFSQPCLNSWAQRKICTILDCKSVGGLMNCRWTIWEIKFQSGNITANSNKSSLKLWKILCFADLFKHDGSFLLNSEKVEVQGS